MRGRGRPCAQPLHPALASSSFRRMTIRRQWNRAALFLVLIVVTAGCVRTAEGPQEEQRNPFFLAGKERLQAMDYQGAADSFERALQDDPKSVLTHFELGVLYDTHLADFPAALYHYNKALKYRPTGYPADTIRYRIPACRQELIKGDSLAVSNPSALRDLEKLREENQELRRQLGELRLAASRRLGVTTGDPSVATSVAARYPAAGGLGSGVGSTISPLASGGSASGITPGSGQTGSVAASSTGRTKTHTVRPGETVASLSRQYNVRIPAILAANRGLDPKRLRVGQTVQIPAR